MRRRRAPYAGLIALGCLSLAPLSASAQDRAPWMPPPPLEPAATPPPPGGFWPEPPRPRSRFAMPSMLTRPLSTPYGMVLLQWGVAYGTSSIARTFSDRSGFGLSMDMSAGLGRGFQLDAGTGVRFGDLIAADRYGRVFRDEVFQTGNRFIGNPWVKLRWSFLDGEQRVFRAGVELLVQAPLAERTAWSIAVGVPVAVALPVARLRLEGGVFAQFILSEGSTLREVLNVPLRLLWSPFDELGVGVVTGFQVGNAFREDATAPNVQFGLVFRYRVGQSVELGAQWVLPVASPHGTDAMGFGFSVTHRGR